MLGSHFAEVVVPTPAVRPSRLTAAVVLCLLGTALVTALVSSSFAGQHVGSQDTSVSMDTTVCEFFVCTSECMSQMQMENTQRVVNAHGCNL